MVFDNEAMLSYFDLRQWIVKIWVQIAYNLKVLNIPKYGSGSDVMIIIIIP